MISNALVSKFTQGGGRRAGRITRLCKRGGFEKKEEEEEEERPRRKEKRERERKRRVE